MALQITPTKYSSSKYILVTSHVLHSHGFHYCALPRHPRSSASRVTLSKSTQSRHSVITTASTISARPQNKNNTYIKVCGVTSSGDAQIAVEAGANLIGMILWPKAKRSISTATAREISAIAKRFGAVPVGVFVEEDAETIVRVCEETGVEIAQLHGDGARRSLLDLPQNLRTIYVMHADKAGALQTPLPSSMQESFGARSVKKVDFILIDSLQGGSGEKFDWDNLSIPSHSETTCGWLLAGGLTPENVEEAIKKASPTGVDVSSGVCCDDGLKKDKDKVFRYVSGAKIGFGW